jgi:branched-chain amino acid transport system permease protein
MSIAAETRVSTGPSVRRLAIVAVAILAVLAALPYIVDVYQTQLLIYGLVFAIAALGFNLLLGYTGLLSFGHSAYFGTGAYTVAFIVRDLGVQSMELCILGGLLGTFFVSALFGFVCVRHTRIFFGILTLALSQVLWSLAFKFFWVTGGTDGIRVASNKLTLLGGMISFGGPGSFQRFVFAYY